MSEPLSLQRDGSTPAVYAAPRTVTDLAECDFYHSMDIPGYGAVEGEWDLRGGEAAYLGNVDLRGKRVLEIGTASGFMCFHMERSGARSSRTTSRPSSRSTSCRTRGSDHAELVETLKRHIGRLNNAYWLAHRAHGSEARVAYGTVYDLPDGLGSFDVSTFGSVLLHLRDPFLALQNALALTTETVVVTTERTQHRPAAASAQQHARPRLVLSSGRGDTRAAGDLVAAHAATHPEDDRGPRIRAERREVSQADVQGATTRPVHGRRTPDPPPV